MDSLQKGSKTIKNAAEKQQNRSMNCMEKKMMYEADLVYDQIESMLGRIAEDNADFVCSTCQHTKDDLLSLAKELLGADARDELEKFYEETAAESAGEESE